MWYKGCARGAMGACTFRTFATILHFDGAFRVTCRGRNYFAVTRQFRCRYFISPLPLASCTLPKCFIAASIYALIFGPSPIEGPATAAHLPNVAHSHIHTYIDAHVMPCNINIVMGERTGEVTRPLTHCALTYAMLEIENDKTKL